MFVEHVRIKASVARLRSSFDMAKNTCSQFCTSADNGGDDGDDGKDDDESQELADDSGVSM